MAIITDLTPYRQYLDDFDLTDEEKLDLVNALQTAAYVIVDKHFGLHRFALPIIPKKPVDDDAVWGHADTDTANHSRRGKADEDET